MKEFQRVSRGQVWYINEDTQITASKIQNDKDHVQAKSRIWLVVSCESNNIYSPIVNCVPITTGNKDNYPMHVFYMMGNHPQVILCEQIRTFNMKDLTDYRYTLTKEVMSKVNDALAGQLELTISIPSYEALMNMIDTIANYKAKEMKSECMKVTEGTILGIANRIQSLFSVTKEDKQAYEDKIIQEVQSANINPEITPEPIAKKVTDKVEAIEEPGKKSGRSKWTPSMMDEFLQDCEKLSTTEIANKYGLRDKKSVYTYKYNFKNLRGKVNGA